MSQLSYSQDPAEALAGMLADGTTTKDAVTRAATETIPFGKFVCHDGGADYKTCALPGAAGDITDDTLLGVALLDTSEEYDSTGWDQYDAVPVLKTGRVWVDVEDAIGGVAPGGGVYINFQNGNEGGVRATTDVDAELAVRWKFTGKVRGTLAVIERL